MEPLVTQPARPNKLDKSAIDLIYELAYGTLVDGAISLTGLSRRDQIF